MEVILIENVDNLGARGQVVKVANGYGRNHLLPKKLAVAATPQNRKWIEQQRQRFLKQEAREKSEAEELARLLEAMKLTFTRKAGEQGTLFGSVTAMDLAEALAARGYQIDRRKIQLQNPLKTAGDHRIPVRLHREVTATLQAVVEAEGQPEIQAEKQTESNTAAAEQPDKS